MFLGIDPGISGYLAAIDDDGSVQFMPAISARPPGGKLVKGSNLYCIKDILEGVYRIGLVKYALIERQQVFPKQGSVSGFTTGFGYGMWRTCLESNYITYREISSKVWKSYHGIHKGDKSKQKLEAIKIAGKLYKKVDLRPIERSPRAKVMDHNKAESLLIADYARHIYYSAKAELEAV